MIYEYRIADIKIRIDTPFAVAQEKEILPFIDEICDNPDLQIKYIPVQTIDVPADSQSHDVNLYSYSEVILSVCYQLRDEVYARIDYLDTEPLSAVCQYKEGWEKELNYSRNFCQMLNFEVLFQRFNGFILHSSYIAWHDIAILFSAPSGTGKSTQADLWQKYENAEIINGDRTCIRKVNNEWMAYGLPYAGTSGIYKNKKYPLKAIFVLRQAKVNTVERMNPNKAFIYLYPEVNMHRWNPKNVEETSDLLISMIQDIPVYLLSCTPDQRAVEAVRKCLEGGMK